MDYLPEQS